MFPLPEDWRRALADELTQPYFEELQAFVQRERSRAVVFPSEAQTFRAFELTRFSDVRVLLLGQDPYHGAGQANGLCFSVPAGVRLPPSLQNIYKELQADLCFVPPAHGDLSHWAAQGVLLLNAVLTVREGEAASHKNRGWERFTDSVIRTLAASHQPVVFVLWGNYAKRKLELISEPHAVIEGVHPSPLSASRGFHGSRPFSAINRKLLALGHDPIAWQLPTTAEI